MADNDNGGSFMTGFLMGGIVGAVIGLLLAPKSGSQTRADLMDQSETWRIRAEEIAARVREGVAPVIEGMRESGTPGMEEGRGHIGQGIDTGYEPADLIAGHRTTAVSQRSTDEPAGAGRMEAEPQETGSPGPEPTNKT